LNGTDLANAIECFDRRLRNEGFADTSIGCLLPDDRPSVGYAVTARIRCSSPPPVGHRYHDRTDWRNYILTVPRPVDDVRFDCTGPTRIAAGRSQRVVAQALADCPDVARERFQQQSEAKLADAERALSFPTVAAASAVGLVPFFETGLRDRYSAIGVNVAVPVLNRNLFAARKAEAPFRVTAGEQVLIDFGIAWPGMSAQRGALRRLRSKGWRSPINWSRRRPMRWTSPDNATTSG
jgi:hypothetical protein